MPTCTAHTAGPFKAHPITWALLETLLLVALTTPVHAYPLFSAPFLSFDAGNCPASVAIADLNEDGRLDLAVADECSDTVSVLLGNGDGTFGTRTEFGAGSVPVSVAIADLNGDGRPDLVAANGNSNTVSVLLGNGDGTFAAKTDFGAGLGPNSMAIADCNEDGQPDLVVVNSGTAPEFQGTISVLLGNGDGSFGASTDFALAGLPRSVAISDVNEDGSPDLAVVAHDADPDIGGTVSVLLGNGNGTFGPATDIDTGEAIPYSVAIADLNADGAPDLAVTNQQGWPLDTSVSRVSVFLGNGDGTFGGRTDFDIGGSPYSVAIADFNGDGRRDLAVTNGDSSAVSVLLGNGDGTFGAKTDFGAGVNPASVGIADFNGDGRPDLAVANLNVPTVTGAGTVSVLLGNGDGTFGATTDFGAGINPLSVAIADLSDDGQPDLALANAGAGPWFVGTVSVLFGNKDGTFGSNTDISMGWYLASMAIADLNTDGWPDLAVANYVGNPYSPGWVSVLLGNGDGTFRSNTDFGTGGMPVSLTIADLNGDGRPDLAVANGPVFPEYLGIVSVLLGNGDGTFGAPTDVGSRCWPYSVAIADLNGDGRPDLAVPSEEPGTVIVLFGNGDGTFGRETWLGFENGVPHYVAIADLNMDAVPDLVAACQRVWPLGSGAVSVYLGNGAGSFGAVARFDTANDPTCVSIADLNVDGRLDLAVSNRGSNTVSVLLGKGDGTFGAKADFGAGSSPSSVAIADLNADSWPDLVVANAGSNSVTVLLNTGGHDPTPVALALVDAHAQPGRVELTWMGASLSGTRATVYRQREGAAWMAVASIAADGTGRFRFEDVDVLSGARYGYRLGIRAGGSEEFAGETWITVPGDWILALATPTPNPATTQLSIAFTLPGAGAARVEVFDVTGRRVGFRDAGSLPAGSHAVTFTEAARWRPGIYLVRLTHGHRSLIARACIVR